MPEIILSLFWPFRECDCTKMKILFLSQIIPWPLDAGPKVKTWNVLQHLRQRGHEIIFFSFIREEEKKHLHVMQENFSLVHTVPIRRSRPADLYYFLRSLLSGRPFLVERDDFPEMRALVRDILAQERPEVIHADQLTMAQYAYNQNFPKNRNKAKVNNEGAPFVIFDAHNAVWTILDRMKQTAPFWLRPFFQREKLSVLRYEGELVRSVDRSLAVSEVDRKALADALRSLEQVELSESAKISVIPIAINTQQLNRVTHQHDSKNILTIGSMHYPPNADGIRWFINEVFPLIVKEFPEATLTVVGKNPPADILKASQEFGQKIELMGYVEKLKPYFERAAVEVVPVRAGGGMRVRLLEAFSRGMPVVTTTIGLEGIEAENNVHVLVRNTPIDFANAVVGLLRDETKQKTLGMNARELAVLNYDWKVALKKLDEIYSEAAEYNLRNDTKLYGKIEAG